MICGVGAGGRPLRRLRREQPRAHRSSRRIGDRKRPGGILYREGIAKISQFSRCCNDDGIPIVWLQDISGFDIGPEAEKQGLLGYGSSLIYTNTTNTVPMFTVLLRKASGAGYYAMDGLPYGPILQLATPLTRLAVMEGRTLAIGAYNTKLDDEFRIVAKTDGGGARRSGAACRRSKTGSRATWTRCSRPAQRDIDEIVRPSELRLWIASLVAMSYQATGYRRIKNPRIWSLHDMDVIRG